MQTNPVDRAQLMILQHEAGTMYTEDGQAE